MVPLSVVETFVTLLSPVLLISIWIAMLMAPCWVKDGFYARFFKAKQSQRVSNVATPKQ
jgi:Mn2+/Fe2+ NRAMP family transporter